ncbi:MAG: hypothetical protein C0592_00265 [Marinilabiliales bacterium]|mgnify:FL=1|nr:MAG: hypothetical protein C0592_00265 [Marinilabiliales bacterium]
MKKDDFSKKLAAYGAVAAATLSIANGQVVYHDVSPDHALSANDVLLIDLDEDATDDYMLRMFEFSSTSIYYKRAVIDPLNGNMVMIASATSAYQWASALNNYDFIGGGTNWLGGMAELGFNYAGYTYGGFVDGNDHYIGLKFYIGGTLHYGWARVNIPSGIPYMLLKDWAYNASADTPLLAGQGIGTGVEDSVLSDAEIFSFDKIVTIKLSEQIDGVVRIYNTIGQMVYSDEISNTEMKIDLSNMQSGIYTVVIESDDNVTQKKVNL